MSIICETSSDLLTELPTHTYHITDFLTCSRTDSLTYFFTLVYIYFIKNVSCTDIVYMSST